MIRPAFLPKQLRLLLLTFLALIPGISPAQNTPSSQAGQPATIDLVRDATQLPQLPGFIGDTTLSAPELYNQLKAWQPTYRNYQQDNLLFHMSYENAQVSYPDLPVRVFLPRHFDPANTYPVILYLHGATQASSFGSNAIARDKGDLFINYFTNKGFIIIKPYADNARKFSWNPNPFYQKTNHTYRVIEQIVIALKKRLPVQENKIFALGHSDGGDGAFCLALYNPSLFAGFYCYNTMATQLFADDIYINNLVNKPLYLVHSDLDALRPANIMEQVTELLKEAHVNYHYKLYKGYGHFDKHLDHDLPKALKNISVTTRDPLPDPLTWESNSPNDNGTIHWLKISAVDVAATKAAWHKIYNFNYYVKEETHPYYQETPGGKIVASYAKNTFTISTSKIKQFELLISPEMVDLSKPVTVIVNNKASTYELTYDRQFMIYQFIQNFDRSAIWCNKILIQIDQKQ